MGRVLVTAEMPAGGLDPVLEAGHEVVGGIGRGPITADELCAGVQTVDGLVCLLTDRIDRDVLQAGRGSLQVVATVSVGYDNVDLKAAAECGVIVCNTPGILDETTADLAWALILGASRVTTEAQEDLRNGTWGGWGIGQYLGHDVHGATLGVVGWGRIGRSVARRASGFNMRVIHHSRTPTGDEGYVEDLDELLRSADVVTIHVPLTPQTHHLIDRRRLSLMRPTAVLVNTSRGAVLDEAAVAEALVAGTLFAVGLDVYEDEPRVSTALLDAPRALLLPHIGSATVETRTEMVRLASRAVAAVLRGEVPPNLVQAT